MSCFNKTIGVRQFIRDLAGLQNRGSFFKCKIVIIRNMERSLCLNLRNDSVNLSVLLHKYIVDKLNYIKQEVTPYFKVAPDFHVV